MKKPQICTARGCEEPGVYECSKKRVDGRGYVTVRCDKHARSWPGERTLIDAPKRPALGVCLCGCGETVNPRRDWKPGHDARGVNGFANRPAARKAARKSGD